MRTPTLFLFTTFSLGTFLSASAAESIDLLPLSQWTNTGLWAAASKVTGSATEKKWDSVTDGEGILFNGQEEKTTNIVSKTSHGDAELLVEFMVPKGSNSGIYFMNRYEVQILDSFGKLDEELKHGDCAGIYQRWDDSKEEKKDKGFEGTAPSTNASTAPGTWQTFKIVFRAPRFDSEGEKTENASFLLVEHNGVVVHENIEVTGPTRGGEGGEETAQAPFKIQGDHGPVAFRKLKFTPLTLD